MSSPRGYANHSVYMARLLLEAWVREQAHSPANAAALDAAFAPALRQHLLDAYGWFLLSTLKLKALPTTPPHRTRDLPAQGEGLARPAEVERCHQLEQQGWLGDLQQPLPLGIPRASSRGQQLLAVTRQYPSVAEFQDWYQQLSTLFEQLGEALDEQ